MKPAQVDRFRREGYLVCGTLFSDAEIEALAQAYDDCLDRLRDAENLKNIRPGRGADGTPTQVNQIRCAHLFHPAFAALVRDARDGLEVLMLQRSYQSGFMPGVHVFPGGGLDPGDESDEAHERSAGPSDAEASRRLGIERIAGAQAIGSPWEPILLAAGFRAGPKRLSLD